MQSQEDLKNHFSPQLGTGERLLWAGQPRQGLFLRATDWVQIPFSLLWGGFACFWEWSAFQTDAPLFFRLWGVPFVLIGIYLVAGRFFVDARLRSKTYYALTSERAIILSGWLITRTTSLQLRAMPGVSLIESPGGFGTITFGATTPWWAGSPGWPGSRYRISPAFDSIAEVRYVYDTLRRAQQSWNPDPTRK